VVFASANHGKFREVAAILADVPVLLLPLDRFGPMEMPPEGGDSFQENARRKALHVAVTVGHHALADDSGLEVDALDGRPGVYSSRYGAPANTDGERNRLLLQELDGIPAERRTARFRCALALADPSGWLSVAEGVCEGRIAVAPRGRAGFGYDPVFEIPSLGATLAELGPAIKDRLSHRALALQQIRPVLESLGRET
jgi:XTP/dITP diphosphohydrolase